VSNEAEICCGIEDDSWQNGGSVRNEFKSYAHYNTTATHTATHAAEWWLGALFRI